MSDFDLGDLGDAAGGGGDVLLMFIGVPGAIILLIASPFIMCSEHNAKKEKERIKIEQAEAKREAKEADPRSLPEKAGATVRDGVIDFGKGLIFGKDEKKAE